jgi:hypothetical protein
MRQVAVRSKMNLAECDLTRLLDSLEGVVNSRLLMVVLAERESERRSGDHRNIPGIEFRLSGFSISILLLFWINGEPCPRSPGVRRNSEVRRPLLR